MREMELAASAALMHERQVPDSFSWHFFTINTGREGAVSRGACAAAAARLCPVQHTGCCEGPLLEPGRRAGRGSRRACRRRRRPVALPARACPAGDRHALHSAGAPGRKSPGRKSRSWGGGGAGHALGALAGGAGGAVPLRRGGRGRRRLARAARQRARGRRARRARPGAAGAAVGRVHGGRAQRRGAPPGGRACAVRRAPAAPAAPNPAGDRTCFRGSTHCTTLRRRWRRCWRPRSGARARSACTRAAAHARPTAAPRPCCA